jgi:hypothetical protein
MQQVGGKAIAWCKSIRRLLLSVLQTNKKHNAAGATSFLCLPLKESKEERSHQNIDCGPHGNERGTLLVSSNKQTNKQTINQ